MAATKRKRSRKITGTLTAACGLLGLSGPQAHATEVSTAVMGYTEPDRVSCFEAVVDATHTFDDGKIGNFHVVFDALTGASANGAVPAPTPQTFTGPSGRGSYVVDPGATPLDPNFRDTRVAGSGGVTLPVGRLGKVSGGLYLSGEHDYTSLGANTSLTRDFDKRNTTVALRASFFHDIISPEGGRPIPMTEMIAASGDIGGDKADDDFNGLRLPGDGTKETLDLGVGVTQVLDPKTVLHVNYTHSRVTGYQTDPYKLLSNVDAATGEPVQYLYENRPDRRGKNILFGRLVRSLAGGALQLSYRYMNDDWSIESHMVEARYRWNLNDRNYLQPHLRWYTQTEAEFYRRYLVASQDLPEHATADYRLGAMDTWTYGLKYGRILEGGREWSVSLSYYLQTGESHPADAVGALRNYDLFPDVSAIYLQVGYTFGM